MLFVYCVIPRPVIEVGMSESYKNYIHIINIRIIVFINQFMRSSIDYNDKRMFIIS